MTDPKTYDFPGRQHVLPRPPQPRPRPVLPPPLASMPQRVAPQCEMRDCPNRADFFWHWGVYPQVSWVPICRECSGELAAAGFTPLTVAPLAETADPLYRGSDHR